MTKIRIREAERQKLKELKEEPVVREMALDEGIIDGEEESLSYRKLIQLIIPEDADVMERPEDDMVWITALEQRERVQEIAGENVSAHKVIRYHLERFMEEEGL